MLCMIRAGVAFVCTLAHAASVQVQSTVTAGLLEVSAGLVTLVSDNLCDGWWASSRRWDTEST